MRGNFTPAHFLGETFYPPAHGGPEGPVQNVKDNFCERGFRISRYNVSSWSCLNRFLNLRRNFENLTFELFSSLHMPVKSWFLLFFENHEVWRDIKHLQLDLVGSSKHQWLPEHLLELLDKNQKIILQRLSWKKIILNLYDFFHFLGGHHSNLYLFSGQKS